ncbi:MAG: antitoxin [Candidatus Binataceae bacterium]
MKQRAIAKVFKTGRSQAVRIPKDFRFECAEVFIERRGQQVILSPRQQEWKSWGEYFANRTPLSDDFPDDIEDAPPQNREAL